MKTLAQIAAEDRKVTQHCWRNYRVTSQEDKDKRRLGELEKAVVTIQRWQIYNPVVERGITVDAKDLIGKKVIDTSDKPAHDEGKADTECLYCQQILLESDLAEGGCSFCGKKFKPSPEKQAEPSFCDKCGHKLS